MPSIGIGITVSLRSEAVGPSTVADGAEQMLAGLRGMIFLNEPDGAVESQYMLPGVFVNEAR